MFPFTKRRFPERTFKHPTPGGMVGDAAKDLSGASGIHPERRYGDCGSYSGNQPKGDIRTRVLQRLKR
jgi:hypothetical protein